MVFQRSSTAKNKINFLKNQKLIKGCQSLVLPQKDTLKSDDSLLALPLPERMYISILILQKRTKDITAD